MRFLLILISFLLPSSGFQYWEEMTGGQQSAVLSSPGVAPIVKEYVTAPWAVSDDDKTYSLLDKLTSACSERGVQALYFYHFNSILVKAEGALGEPMPEYVYTLIERDPEFVFNYLRNHLELRECYVLNLALYFYYHDDENLQASEQLTRKRCPKDTAQWISAFYADVKSIKDAIDYPCSIPVRLNYKQELRPNATRIGE